MAVTNITIPLLMAYATFAYAAIIIYRLCFHPLANFRGPKLAAATGWYEFYYDVIKGGQFYREIKRMHEKYGPIVRINPKEVHILDTSFYDDIYAPASKKRDKYADWVVFLGVPTGAFATCPHEHHRRRRDALNASFSKKAIYEAEPLIQQKIDLLCSRLDGIADAGEVVRLDVAFFALANDIITEYTFGEGYDCLGQSDFQQEFKRILLSAVETGALIRQFPWIVPLVRRIPPWALEKISSDFAAVLNWESIVHQRVHTLIETRKLEKVTGKQTGSTSVFTRLLDSDLPEDEKSFQRLVDEGKSLMGAGSETTSWTLTLLIWYVTRDKQILDTLRLELRDMPRNRSGSSLLKWLEQKEYLSAVIHEALRLNHGAIGRLPRVARESIQHGDWEIPAGTPLSSTNYWVHMDETIFPNPSKFSPDRWLGDAAVSLRKYMVSFSRGSRRCVGQNLALAELYLAVAWLVLLYNVEFIETTEEDILPDRDCFIPRPVAHSKGVQARIRRL